MSNNTMRTFTVVMVVLLAVMGLGSAFDGLPPAPVAAQNTLDNTITVTGFGLATGIPDVAYIKHRPGSLTVSLAEAGADSIALDYAH